VEYVSKPTDKEIANSQKIIVLRPGLVLLRDFLSPSDQLSLLQTVMEKGEGEGGFYHSTGTGGVYKLNMGTRGRLISSSSSFPPHFSCVCRSAVDAAHDTLPDMSPSTLLINYYRPLASFKWHRDSENPQLLKNGMGKPVVSFSIGLAAEFAFKDAFEETNYKSVRLNSGDVIIFGGKSRMIVHSVLSVIPHTMPSYLINEVREGRLNITFREVEGVLDDTQFPKYRVKYDIEVEKQ